MGSGSNILANHDDNGANASVIPRVDVQEFTREVFAIHVQCIYKLRSTIHMYVYGSTFASACPGIGTACMFLYGIEPHHAEDCF